MRGAVLIGCSGWQYRDWRGAVYPTDVPMRSWLRWYAERLPTVELNTSFYLLPNHPRLLTADWTYLRFHGPHALERPYRGAYSGPALRAWAEWIEDVRSGGKDVCGYFNNDVEAQAFTDCRRLTEMVHRVQHATR